MEPESEEGTALGAYPVASAWAAPVRGGGVIISGSPGAPLAQPGFVEAFTSFGDVAFPAEPEASVAVETLALGEVTLGSGRLAAIDPIAPARVEVLELEIEPGDYPCFLSHVDEGPVGLLIRLGEHVPVHWEDASAVDGEPGWATVDVDSGSIALCDAGLARELHTDFARFGDAGWPAPTDRARRVHAAVTDGDGVLVAIEEGVLATAVPGDDYPYPIVQGRDEDGQVVAVLIDCCLLPLCARDDDPDDDPDDEEL